VSKVVMVDDGKRERELLLVERLVVGRDPACDISFDDGLLSRRHAEFIAAASAVTVRDLGSRNGVFVNGTRRAEQALKPGDVVQIGPLRVRYLRDHAATGGSPTPADLDGTLMIPAGPARAEPVMATPPPSPVDVFRPTATDDDLDYLDGEEGETRVVGGGAFAQAVRVAATPTPRPVPMPFVAAPTPSEPLASAVQSAQPPSLASFVLIQLGTLAIIVFVATVVPIVLFRGTVLNAIAEGRVAGLLVWPLLPLVIAVVATVVIANSVNRRITDALAAGRQDLEG
jgi:predicted component of type VI protein secretion system